MKLSLLLPLVTLASHALGNSLSSRQAATILNDISIITTRLNQVKADVDAFQGGPTSSQAALKIQQDSTSLSNALSSAAADAKNSPVLGDSDSASVANAVVTLQPTIFNVLSALTAKKNGFRTSFNGASAVPAVAITLRTLRKNTGEFGGNVTLKLTSVLAKAAPLLTGNIDYHFQRAVDAFSTP